MLVPLCNNKHCSVNFEKAKKAKAQNIMHKLKVFKHLCRHVLICQYHQEYIAAMKTTQCLQTAMCAHAILQ